MLEQELAADAMRQRWQPNAAVSLSTEELTELIQPLLPGEKVLSSMVASGGLSNTNIRVECSGAESPLLVRIYSREAPAAGKEFALNRLTHLHVPSPAFLFHSLSNAITGHPYAILQWVEGERLELVTSRLHNLSDLGQSVGLALGAVHSFKFEHSGFLRDDLTPIEPLDLGRSGLLSYIKQCLLSEPARQRVDERLVAALLDFVEREGHLLDSWCQPACLSHSDFGGSNILVRECAGQWKVSAVLDWEFAFSGAPFFDFGNLLRPPLGLREDFTEGLSRGYVSAGGHLPTQWKRIAKLGDLSAWVEFLTRENPGDALIADAVLVLQRTIQQW